MGTVSTRYSPEVRERAVRMVAEHESEPNRGRRFPGFDGRIDGVTAHSRVEIQTLDPVNLQ